MKRTAKRYFLDQDNDSHWFLVDASKRKEWEAWKALGPDDVYGWTWPAHASELTTEPNQVEFEKPTEL